MKTRQSKKPQILVILGPTASGKSELAVKLAKKFNAEIISADSRQIYKGLDIGSGKVPRDKTKSYKLKAKSYLYKGIPHYLLDVASPKRTFTVAQYQKLAKKALQKILKRGKLSIICGGTGFYIDALIYDYHLPKVPPQPKLRKELDKKSNKELFKQLKKLDPQRAKTIDKNNRRRLIRALEIVLITKRPVPVLNTITCDSKISSCEILKIGIKKSAEELKKMIKQRLLKRLRQGLIEEVERLHEQGLSWKRLDDLGLEYRYVSRYLRDLITKKEMIEILEKEIYRYAKRQMTWFKKDKEIHWTENKREAFRLLRNFCGFSLHQPDEFTTMLHPH